MWWDDGRLGSGVGEDEPTPTEMAESDEGLRVRGADPGAEARGSASHCRGETCDDCVISCAASSWEGAGTSDSFMGSASLLVGQGADVESCLRDRSIDPPVSCSGTILI